MMGDCDICHHNPTDPQRSKCGHWFCRRHFFTSSNAAGITERVCPIDCKGLELVSYHNVMLPVSIQNAEGPGPVVPTSAEEQVNALERQKEELLTKLRNEEGRRVKAEESMAREKMLREKEEDRRVKAEEALAREKVLRETQAIAMEQQNRAKEKAFRQKYVDAYRKLHIAFLNVWRDLHASPPPPKSGVEDDRQPEGASASPHLGPLTVHPRPI
ncbi:Hypp484 [Branchiostoma lanceolatum]|uniref:Hypp484 protein n=1 Tax=Branchiostoma lanceolatum TaxID=7740 RepID=A0A8J9YJK8_BRALA|nr:Hypp484 [Branchiostoma lanceolatum]